MTSARLTAGNMAAVEVPEAVGTLVARLANHVGLALAVSEDVVASL